jgi:hypothetical protein
MRKTALVSFITAAVLLGLSAPYVDASGNSCYQTKLSQYPSWIGGVLAREDGSQVIVVDPAQNRLLAYNPSGELSLPDVRVKGLREPLPTAIDRTDGDNLLLELADGALVQLDRNFTSDGASVLVHQRATGLHIGSLYQWKVIGSYLIAYGSLLDDKGSITLGFFRLPLWGDSQAPEILTPLAPPDFYLIGNTYIASIGSTAYYVTMGKNPAIFKASPGQKAKRMLSFPAELHARPDFTTKMTGPRSAAPHFAELENFTIASGLYAQGGFLYLLARKPILGRTAWYLYKIDPGADRLVSSTRLPTQAHHLAIAVSKSKWFLFERGPVQEGQRQTIDNMIVIEGSAIGTSVEIPTSCQINVISKKTPAAKTRAASHL